MVKNVSTKKDKKAIHHECSDRHSPPATPSPRPPTNWNRHKIEHNVLGNASPIHIPPPVIPCTAACRDLALAVESLPLVGTLGQSGSVSVRSRSAVETESRICCHRGTCQYSCTVLRLVIFFYRSTHALRRSERKICPAARVIPIWVSFFQGAAMTSSANTVVNEPFVVEQKERIHRDHMNTHH